MHHVRVGIRNTTSPKVYLSQLCVLRFDWVPLTFPLRSVGYHGLIVIHEPGWQDSAAKGNPSVQQKSAASEPNVGAEGGGEIVKLQLRMSRDDHV